MPPTHEVINQPPPLADLDVFGADTALVEGVARHGAGAAAGRLTELGRLAGSATAQQWGAAANAVPPVLRTHDRYGHRIDEVEFVPAWHELLRVAVQYGLHGTPWAAAPGVAPPCVVPPAAVAPGAAHVARAAGFFVWSQVEAGHGCPISMTYSVLPALRTTPDLAARYGPGLTSTTYDPGLREPTGKAGLLAGMAMTEKQGGSDVRANTTRAVPAGDGSYLLTGHKWFCSAPMCDVFLVLAVADPATRGSRAAGGTRPAAAPTGPGPTCFLVPRVRPDGTRNPFLLQRLKDKLGNRSNASAEVEFDGTVGWPVGDLGRGIPTIIEMVRMTRLDCVIGSAAAMRAATTQAIHHATHRSAFGGPLRSAPLMRAVLADLALETEAATALALRLAAAVDGQETAFGRLATAVGKFWVCKRAVGVVAEALECLGGNGYVEDSGLPRLYREVPVNSIWEGSGNVIALDVLRAIGRQPESTAAFLAELDAAGGADRRLDDAVRLLRHELADAADPAVRARRVTALMALCLQGALLVRYAPAVVADAFCASRLTPGGPPTAGSVAGLLPPGLNAAAVVDRAAPPT